MGGARSTYGGEERCIEILVENPEGRPRRTWEENIQMYLGK
jgi:hypothetical protein